MKVVKLNLGQMWRTFSSHYYKVYKITDEHLEFVVNKPDDATPLNSDATFPIGKSEI